MQSRALGSKALWGSRTSTQRTVTAGLPERYQTMVWEMSSTMRVVVVVPGHGDDGPRHVGLLKEGFQRKSSGAFQPWATILPKLTGLCWRVEGSVQAQSGNQGNRLAQGLTAVRQVEDGIAVVPHRHQRAMGHPATSATGGHYHLPFPVGDLLVPPSLPLVVARRRRQHGEHRQSPIPTGPRNMAQPIREIQRRPLDLTSWWRLEWTASRQMPRALILGPRRRSRVSLMPKTSGPSPHPAGAAAPTGCGLPHGATTPSD